MGEEALFIGLVVAVGLVIVFLAILAARLEKKRQEAIAREAERLNFRFSPERDVGLARQFEHLDGLGDGKNRYAFNVLDGQHRGRRITAFDFHYETHSTDSKGRRNTHRHYRHAMLLHLEREFPSLIIGPEGIFSKIAQAVGYDDIDFESHEFSRLFCVRSPDKRFAYDFCNPAMIECLLARPDTQLEVRGEVLAFVYDGTMQPLEIAGYLDQACDIRERLPAYLFA